MKIPKNFAVLGGALAFLVFWVVGSYNGLVSLNEEVDSSWAQVETQYQRRFDLIPNLVEATKGVMSQEQEVFGTIAKARQGYAGASTQSEKVKATGELESSLARLLVIMENYPELKSNETVLALMDELTGTENRVSVERSRYNGVVKTFNVKVKTIPTVFIANVLNFDEREFFEAVEQAEQAPKVDLKLSE